MQQISGERLQDHWSSGFFLQDFTEELFQPQADHSLLFLYWNSLTIFIAPAYSRVRYRSSNFRPSVRSFVRSFVRPFVRSSVNIYVEV